jgi:hypothetical protein
MEAWKSFYGEAVKDGCFNDTQDNLTSHRRGWDNTGKALGKTKEPNTRPVPKKPVPKEDAPPKTPWWEDTDETDWLYD